MTDSTVASQRVADAIAERIIAGTLPPGTRIKQDDLAQELGVSRIPVRDALRMLESRGLVSLKANSGARVTSLTAHDLDVSYRIRERLEPMLLGESLPHLTDADIAAMRAAQAALDRVDSVDNYMPLSRAFHWTAFSRHQAPLLAQIVERLWDTTQSYRAVYARLALADAGVMDVMRAERDLLMGAIERRELDLAPRLLGLHIRRTHLSLRAIVAGGDQTKDPAGEQA
jgi:DNA-binding GntR family transcriptional regulator